MTASTNPIGQNAATEPSNALSSTLEDRRLLAAYKEGIRVHAQGILAAMDATAAAVFASRACHDAMPEPFDRLFDGIMESRAKVQRFLAECR